MYLFTSLLFIRWAASQALLLFFFWRNGSFWLGHHPKKLRLVRLPRLAVWTFYVKMNTVTITGAGGHFVQGKDCKWGQFGSDGLARGWSRAWDLSSQNLPPFEVLTGCKDLIEFPIALILFAKERRRHLKWRFLKILCKMKNLHKKSIKIVRLLYLVFNV